VDVDPLAVDLDAVIDGVDAHAEGGHLAVHRNATVADELLAGTPRRDPRSSEHLLEPGLILAHDAASPSSAVSSRVAAITSRSRATASEAADSSALVSSSISAAAPCGWSRVGAPPRQLVGSGSPAAMRLRAARGSSGSSGA